MDAVLFRKIVVEKAIQDFIDNPYDLKEACSAAWTLDAYASYIYLATKHGRGYARDSRFKEDYLASRDRDFLAVFHASTALKHAELSDKNKTIKKAGDIYVTYLDGFAWYFSGASDIGYQVIIQNDNFLFTSLNDAVPRALEFLDTFLSS